MRFLKQVYFEFLDAFVFNTTVYRKEDFNLFLQLKLFIFLSTSAGLSVNIVKRT